MMRRIGWWTVVVVAAAPLGLLVVGKLVPPQRGLRAALPSVSTGPAERDARDPGLHPVLIRQPETLGVVDTELRDVRGTPGGVACATCHSGGAGAAIAARAGAPEEFHAGVELAHGELSCASCHDPVDRTRLRLADGTVLAAAEVMRLCGQCHGPQTRDYERGSHGGMTGYWDLSRGPRVRNSCVACHAPHQPAYPTVMPAAPPRDRFLPQHAEPRPAVPIPDQAARGARSHD